MNISHAAQNSTFKNHPRDISRDENHLYRIVLFHIIHKIKYNKTLTGAGYRISKNCQNSNFSHTTSLTTVSRLEAKQSSTWSPFYATVTNSLVGCAFWSSNECRPSAPCLFFYLQSVCLSSSSSNETISRC